MLKKIKTHFLTITIFIFFIAVWIFSLLLPDKKFSSEENRVLQQTPVLNTQTVFEKTFMSDLEIYFSDQFPARNELVKLNTYIQKYILRQECVNNVYFGKSGYLFNYYSDKDIDQKQIKTNVDSLNDFKTRYACDVYLIPSSFDISNHLPDVYCNINANELLSDIHDIDYVDWVLKPYIDDYIFYKTDHHWTTFGAYCLYKNIVDHPVDYQVTPVSSDFLGTIHSKLNIRNAADEIYAPEVSENITVQYDFTGKDSTLYFPKYLKEKDKYAYFLDGNHGFVNIKNDQAVGNLLIIKDSFANCLIPFLTNNYQNIDVVDLRYFNMHISKLIADQQYDRIIVLYNKVNFMQDNNIFKLKK